MKRISYISTLIIIMVTAVGCGSSTPGTTTNSVDLSESATLSSDAVAMAVAVSDAGGDAGHTSTVFDATTMPLVKSITSTMADGAITFTSVDHEIPEQNGTGTFVVNGTSVLADSASVYNKKASGDLDVQLKDVTKTVTVDGTTYTVITNGKLKITYSGTEMPADVKTSQTYTNIVYNITGSDLAITGTTTGTITDLKAVREMNVTMVDGVATRVSTCSGTATIKTDAETVTCTYRSDCGKCN